MKVSFVIPAYNEEFYIEKCLISVLREVKENTGAYEIIVVNNGSTDKTKEIALRFSGVTVVDEPERGLPRARQAGFLASRGDLIANIDADTLLPSGWLRYAEDQFSKNQKLVALSGPFVYYDLPKNINFWVKALYGIGFISYLINRFILRVGSMIQGGNFIIRRSVLEKIGGYNLRINFYGEDSDIARRLNPLGEVKFTFKLPMYASGRRLMKEGTVKMGVRYGINYLWTIFFKKPFSNQSPQAIEGKPIYVRKTISAPKIFSGVTISVLALLLFLVFHFSTLANFENSSKKFVSKIHTKIITSKSFQKLSNLEKEMRE